MSSFAGFVTHTFRISDLVTLNDGLRIGGSWLHSTFEDKTFFPFPYDDINQSTVVASGNVGIIYTPTSWKLSLMSSTGFRVPNIDDLAKVFDSATGDAVINGILIVPNPNLKPEKTINVGASITKFFGDKLRLETVLFATRFFDAIATRPTTFNGQSVIDYDGFPANVFSSQNVGKAILYGYSASLRADFSSAWAATASYNYTHGEVINEGRNAPLDHIAPVFGRISVQYIAKKFNAELFSNFSGWKYMSKFSSSGEDNPQYAPAEGMPSWYTINLRTSYDLTSYIKVQVGVDNALDLQYRTFASGINASGRNLTVAVRAKI
jgi:hemoglobin/transferrin/lactoferrin receptor protein